MSYGMSEFYETVLDALKVEEVEDDTSATADRVLEAIDRLEKVRDAARAVLTKFESNPDDLETMDAGIKLLKAALGEPEATARGNRIVIVLDGGLVQNVITETGGYEFIILDHDTEGADATDPWLCKIRFEDGEETECFAREDSPEVNPGEVEAIFASYSANSKEEEKDEFFEGKCSNPGGHEWNRTLGEADEARLSGDHENDNIRCIHCGADGDA